MAISSKIKVQLRADEGKGASRRLRREGMVPAVIYGGGKDPVNIQLSHNEVLLASEHEWFYSSILDLSLDGKVQKVLLRDMQRHPYKRQVMHLDFMRVRSDEVLRTSVPLNMINVESSPAGKSPDVVVMHELTEVEVSCLPGNLPGNIEVDLSKLSLGDVIRLSDLVLPEGVEIPALALGPDHDVAVVIARQARVEAEDDAAGEGESADGESGGEGKGE